MSQHRHPSLTRREFLAAGALGAAGLGLPLAGRVRAAGVAESARPLPNIVYILCDDLGYGDVRALNPDGRIATPNLDRLAGAGMRFTDAHSGSAVCTPTRYGILTGRYCFRSSLASGVLGGYSRPLIPSTRLTVASYLKARGYHTACLGKWHLGLDWPLRGGGLAKNADDGWAVEYAAPVGGGPVALGFDSWFGISASLDMPPYVFIENDRCTAVPTVEKTFLRKGPAAADFGAVDVLPELTRRAVACIEARAAAPEQPFFLYLALNSPHTPIVPAPEFAGKSGLNPYADFVMQTDAAIGQVLDALDRHGLAADTLVFAASDNGCSPAANVGELVKAGHHPSHVFRGYKADIFEGGHRIPFLARWPGRTAPGSCCEQTVCLTDLLATCAEIAGPPLPAEAGEDSVSLLPCLLGTARGLVREAVVHHSINGSFAIRQGKWKLELCSGSGGWSAPKPGSPEAKALPPVQLYDLAQDPGEIRNLQADVPQEVQRLRALLLSTIERGRSTPGPPQRNDRTIRLPG